MNGAVDMVENPSANCSIGGKEGVDVVDAEVKVGLVDVACGVDENDSPCN